MLSEPRPGERRPRILLATTNPHKLDEIRAIFAPFGIEATGLDALDLDHDIEEPTEDAETFAGNAQIKAAHYARAAGRACLADDSGLEVDALGGRPGVLSARYAGVGETRAERDRANNAKLLAELRAARVPFEKRTARFVCVMALAHPSGEIIARTRGTFAGLITDEPRGENGFGYDPLLYVPDAQRTSAQLPPEEKNARSHRGAAARAMAPRIAALAHRIDP